MKRQYCAIWSHCTYQRYIYERHFLIVLGGLRSSPAEIQIYLSVIVTLTTTTYLIFSNEAQVSAILNELDGHDRPKRPCTFADCQTRSVQPSRRNIIKNVFQKHFLHRLYKVINILSFLEGSGYRI